MLPACPSCPSNCHACVRILITYFCVGSIAEVFPLLLIVIAWARFAAPETLDSPVLIPGNVAILEDRRETTGLGALPRRGRDGRFMGATDP